MFTIMCDHKLFHTNLLNNEFYLKLLEEFIDWKLNDVRVRIHLIIKHFESIAFNACYTSLELKLLSQQFTMFDIF